MRARWDEIVERSQRAVREAGVEIRSVDKDAFRAAVKPLLERHLREPETERLYAKLRGAA